MLTGSNDFQLNYFFVTFESYNVAGCDIRHKRHRLVFRFRSASLMIDLTVSQGILNVIGH